MTTIKSFVNRLKKIGVEVELSGNFPWIYLEKVNGRRVYNKYLGNHGFTVFFMYLDPDKGKHCEDMTDISIIFEQIRDTLCSDLYHKNDVLKAIYQFNSWRKEQGNLGQNEPELIEGWFEQYNIYRK